MTRKDYVLLAEKIRMVYQDHQRCRQPGQEISNCAAAVRQTAVAIGDALAKDNPRFDREHFLAVVRGDRPLNSKPPKRQKGGQADASTDQLGTYLEAQHDSR